MTMLHLIRHGKATPAKASYDELHPLGETQARLLGAHLARVGQRFDAIYCGPLQRQRETLRLMRDAAVELGVAWPQEHILDALAEAPIEALMRQCLPEQLAHDAALQGLVAALGDGSDHERTRLALEPIFDHVVGLWVSGVMARPDIETAPQFGARVVAALEHILRVEGESRHVAVVTSNGVIGRLVEHINGVADADRTGPAQRYRNSSRTCVLFRDGCLRVEVADDVGHLADAQLHTFL